MDESYTAYKRICKEDKYHARKYREELATARAEVGNNTIATEIRNIQVREQQRTTARRVKTAFGKYRGQGTTKIEITLEGGSIREITNQVTMEKHILYENISKVHQTEKGPHFEEDLLSNIGLLGDGPAVDSILDGTYIPPPGTS